MTVTLSIEFQNLGDPGLSRFTLSKTDGGYLFRLDEVDHYGVSIELNEEQLLGVLSGLEIAKQEAEDAREETSESPLKDVKAISTEGPDPNKNGVVIVSQSKKHIGLFIAIENTSDIEPYFSIETCEEIILIIKRVLGL